MKSKAISKKEVQTICRLAHIDLDEDELEEYTHQLVDIVQHIATLDEIDVKDVSRTTHLSLEECPLHRDAVVSGLSTREALKEAPDKSEEHFRVPRVIP